MSLHRNPTYNNATMHGYMRSQGLETDKPSQVADGFRLGWVAAMDFVAIRDMQDAFFERAFQIFDRTEIVDGTTTKKEPKP